MSYNDPLLAPTQVNYSQYVDSELERLEIAKQQLLKAKENINYNNTPAPTKSVSLWETIDTEISSLTVEQQKLLGEDEVYRSIDNQLQILIQTELINSVRDKVANSEQGKALLEKQLENIKEKKSKIVEESNRDIELFKKFQIAAQANPNLTYVEFIKAINNEK